MACRSSLQPLALAALAARRAAARPARTFHSTRPALVKVGDAVPDVPLVENSPGNKVSLAEEFSGHDGVIVGVPGAFSPGCSQSHIPGYLIHQRIKDVGKVFVVAVNDPFVMQAWGEALDPGQAKGVRFLGDPAGTFTKALDLDFDATKIFGNARSKRYALVIEDGRVKSVHIEKDNVGIHDSSAEKVLGPPTMNDWDA